MVFYVSAFGVADGTESLKRGVDYRVSGLQPEVKAFGAL